FQEDHLAVWHRNAGGPGVGGARAGHPAPGAAAERDCTHRVQGARRLSASVRLALTGL
ncbi:unnamed protein product, partial [Plutella xylostella]